MSENIRVAVEWSRGAFFAGEAVECKVTFRNASDPFQPLGSPSIRENGRLRDRWKPRQSQAAEQAHRARFHRTTPSGSTLASTQDNPSLLSGPTDTTSRQNRASSATPDFRRTTSHSRSISIVSLGSDVIEESASYARNRTRPYQHGRSASLQFMPSRGDVVFMSQPATPVVDVPPSKPITRRRPVSFARDPRVRYRDGLVQETHINLPILEIDPLEGNKSEPLSTVGESPEINDRSRDTLSKGPIGFPRQSSSPLLLEVQPAENGPDIDRRIAGPSSNADTPRSSAELASVSNHSSDSHFLGTASHSKDLASSQNIRRSLSGTFGPPKRAKAETLLIGYGQLMGSFVLDGSLIDPSPFEEIKHMRIVGGQGGGGMVRTNSTKRENGLLGSFGLGNLGEKFNGLLGESGISSMKDAKKMTSAKSVPILSTPQSIFFIELKLLPGETKSFSFKHPLPQGIPPSYKGKAIRINYNLAIGAQLAGSSGQQNNVKSSEFPFRVIPSINADGQVLGHDLMSPHTFLSNEATILSVNESSSPTPSGNGYSNTGPALNSGSMNVDTPLTSDDLSSYIANLLSNKYQSLQSGLMSPTECTTQSRSESMAYGLDMSQTVDLAVLASSVRTTSNKATNRFEINRNGDKVAQIMFSRVRYKLGETVPVVIDFAKRLVPCYSVHASLESAERVEPSLALRSKASVQRVTRRVYASQYESTISAQRILFAPMIPTNTTPNFVTSGVSLEWYLRFEFATLRTDSLDDLSIDQYCLLEEIAKDERGRTTAAVQGLPCETFDVSVPLQVYGAVPVSDDELRHEELLT